MRDTGKPARDNVVLEAFTELAPHYEETMDQELKKYLGLGYSEFVDRLVEAAAINEGDIVLDVATGTAFVPLKLADRLGVSGRVVGLDITPAMLAHGQARIEAGGGSSHISMVCASAMAMPFAQGVFDVVACGLAMHHMDASQMVSQARRALKTGGRLVMADVGASAFWRSRWGTLLVKVLLVRYGVSLRSSRGRAEIEALPNIRTADEWRTILSDFGFTQIEITESRASRPWYPCALILRAVAGEV